MDRCPICDRADCKMPTLEKEPLPWEPEYALRADCAAHRVDWRERCRRAEAALSKINDIRNSIIGHQTMNWSEHIYPLVAALNEAGMEGMPYDKARPHFASLHERLATLEDHFRSCGECSDCLAESGVKLPAKED